MKLTPIEFRQEWIKALRSGDYKQSKHVLHEQNGGFCCLGVACEIYNKFAEEEEKLKITDEERIDDYHDIDPGFVTITAYDGNSVTLPERVVNALGIADDVGTFRSSVDYGDTTLDKGEHALTEINDGIYTFEQIASIIEVESKNLFPESE